MNFFTNIHFLKEIPVISITLRLTSYSLLSGEKIPHTNKNNLTAIFTLTSKLVALWNLEASRRFWKSSSEKFHKIVPDSHVTRFDQYYLKL